MYTLVTADPNTRNWLLNLLSAKINNSNTSMYTQRNSQSIQIHMHARPAKREKLSTWDRSILHLPTVACLETWSPSLTTSGHSVRSKLPGTASAIIWKTKSEQASSVQEARWGSRVGRSDRSSAKTMVGLGVPGRCRWWSGDANPGSGTVRRRPPLSSLVLLSSTSRRRWRWRVGAGKEEGGASGEEEATGTRGGASGRGRVYAVRARVPLGVVSRFVRRSVYSLRNEKWRGLKQSHMWPSWMPPILHPTAVRDVSGFLSSQVSLAQIKKKPNPSHCKHARNSSKTCKTLSLSSAE